MENEVCPSYSLKREFLYSPLGRLSSLKLLIDNDGDIKDIERSLLSCNGCGRCKEVCPLDMDIGELVTKGRNVLYKKGVLPGKAQKRIIDSILLKGNALAREEKKRLIYNEPFYDKFLNRESDTLLFLGCISSFFHADAIKSSIGILDFFDIPFRLIRDEGCCGIFLYDGGYFDKAGEVFRKNRDRFVHLGIKKMVVLCPSCYKCFKMYYPKILGTDDFEVIHFIEALAKELNKGKRFPVDIKDDFILHEPCKMTRSMDIIDEPRNVLNLLGIKFAEFEQNRQMSFCCGAGSGVRAYDMELSLGIAGFLIDKAKGRHIVTLCPFCNMNLAYASRKHNRGIKVFYFSEVLFPKTDRGCI